MISIYRQDWTHYPSLRSSNKEQNGCHLPNQASQYNLIVVSPRKKTLLSFVFYTPCFVSLFSDTLKASGKKVLVPTRKAIIQRGSSGKRCWTTWECDSPAKLHFAGLLTRRSAPNRTKEENVNSEAGVSADRHE